jgi:hypothetical protein
METIIDGVDSHVNNNLSSKNHANHGASTISGNEFRKKSVESYLSRQCGDRATAKHVILARAVVSGVVDDAMFRQLYVSLSFSRADGTGFTASNATMAALLNTTEGVVKNTNTRLIKAGVAQNRRLKHAPSVRTFHAVSHLLDPILPPIEKSLGGDLTEEKSLGSDLTPLQVTPARLENGCQVTPAGTQELTLTCLDRQLDRGVTASPPEVVVAPQPQRTDDRPPKTTTTKTSPSPAVPENDSKEHLAWLRVSLAEHGAAVNCVSIKHELFTIDLLKAHMAGTLAGLPKAEADEIVLSHALRWAAGLAEPARTPDSWLGKVIKGWKLEKDVNGQITKEALAAAKAAPGSRGTPASSGRYVEVNGSRRFNDSAKLPRVQFHALTGEDGNRILDSVHGATTETVMRAIEDAGRRAAKDVSFGDVIGFCIDWCEKWVGRQNAE